MAEITYAAEATAGGPADLANTHTVKAGDRL